MLHQGAARYGLRHLFSWEQGGTRTMGLARPVAVAEIASQGLANGLASQPF